MGGPQEPKISSVMSLPFLQQPSSGIAVFLVGSRNFCAPFLWHAEMSKKWVILRELFI
jgi:hypothetical protein